jgi:hypothetical protein
MKHVDTFEGSLEIVGMLLETANSAWFQNESL